MRAKLAKKRCVSGDQKRHTFLVLSDNGRTMTLLDFVRNEPTARSCCGADRKILSEKVRTSDSKMVKKRLDDGARKSVVGTAGSAQSTSTWPGGSDRRTSSSPESPGPLTYSSRKPWDTTSLKKLRT
jgi:hypothetical protein